MTLLASFVGFMGSFYRRTCLFFYILLLLLFSLAPLGAVTMLLFINPSEVYERFEGDKRETLKDNLVWFRWVGLIICGIEVGWGGMGWELGGGRRGEGNGTMGGGVRRGRSMVRGKRG